MFPFLNRTYPVRPSRLWVDSLVCGLLIWAILFLLQPFGLSAYPGNLLLFTLLFGVITAGAYALYCWAVFRPLTRRVKPWRIWHQILAVLGLLFFIAVCNVVLPSFIYHYDITLGGFLQFFYWTLNIGIFISAVSTLLEYNRYQRDQLQALLSNTADEQRDICITIHDTTVRGNDLTLPINDLLYIEAQKNNVSVCYLREGNPTHVDLHTTLSAVIDDLKPYPNIFQCHRSFVVNVNNITSAQGNSNGYQLRLGTSVNDIPVSRAYVAQLKSYIA